MPQQKSRNGNGPRQTYYVNKPIKSPHKTSFKTPVPLTYQFADKRQADCLVKPKEKNIIWDKSAHKFVLNFF